MSLFDTIKYPILDWDQAQEMFIQLPYDIQNKYRKWSANRGHLDGDLHLAELRKIISEHEE